MKNDWTSQLITCPPLCLGDSSSLSDRLSPTPLPLLSLLMSPRPSAFSRAAGLWWWWWTSPPTRPPSSSLPPPRPGAVWLRFRVPRLHNLKEKVRFRSTVSVERGETRQGQPPRRDKSESHNKSLHSSMARGRREQLVGGGGEASAPLLLQLMPVYPRVLVFALTATILMSFLQPLLHS